MKDLSKIIGQRIRNHRTEQHLSQEKLAELCGCHPTYIGQIERGEKNATLESIGRIATALNVPLATLFEKIGSENTADSIPLKCYELISSKSKAEQEQLYALLLQMEQYKNQL